MKVFKCTLERIRVPTRMPQRSQVEMAEIFNQRRSAVPWALDEVETIVDKPYLEDSVPQALEVRRTQEEKERGPIDTVPLALDGRG